MRRQRYSRKNRRRVSQFPSLFSLYQVEQSKCCIWIVEQFQLQTHNETGVVLTQGKFSDGFFLFVCIGLDSDVHARWLCGMERKAIQTQRLIRHINVCEMEMSLPNLFEEVINGHKGISIFTLDEIPHSNDTVFCFGICYCGYIFPRLSLHQTSEYSYKFYVTAHTHTHHVHSNASQRFLKTVS